VDLSAAFVADLTHLTHALDRPGADLETALRSLGAGARTAVPSFLGLTMTLMTDGVPFSFTVFELRRPGQPVVSSLLVPLALLADVESGSRLVLYAARPGAFVDLAADLAFSLGVALPALPADQDLRHPDPNDEFGLADLSTINRAIGVLVDRGRTPAEARAELRSACTPDLGLVAAADLVMLSLDGRRSDPR
jgi:hypothetical protein